MRGGKLSLASGMLSGQDPNSAVVGLGGEEVKTTETLAPLGWLIHFYELTVSTKISGGGFSLLKTVAMKLSVFFLPSFATHGQIMIKPSSPQGPCLAFCQAGQSSAWSSSVGLDKVYGTVDPESRSLMESGGGLKNHPIW
jgi:hypothetical protein